MGKTPGFGVCVFSLRTLRNAILISVPHYPQTPWSGPNCTELSRTIVAVSLVASVGTRTKTVLNLAPFWTGPFTPALARRENDFACCLRAGFPYPNPVRGQSGRGARLRRAHVDVYTVFSPATSITCAHIHGGALIGFFGPVGSRWRKVMACVR